MAAAVAVTDVRIFTESRRLLAPLHAHDLGVAPVLLMSNFDSLAVWLQPLERGGRALCCDRWRARFRPSPRDAARLPIRNARVRNPEAISPWLLCSPNWQRPGTGRGENQPLSFVTKDPVDGQDRRFSKRIHAPVLEELHTKET
jgi:hypothetical protein